jgi:hypothetical protein
MTTVLTVTEACARIPDLDMENAANEIIDELADTFDIHVANDERAEVMKSIERSLRFVVNRALWALEPATIVADPEDDDA